MQDPGQKNQLYPNMNSHEHSMGIGSPNLIDYKLIWIAKRKEQKLKNC